MPRAQALSEILLQNSKSLSPHLHSLPSPKDFCSKTNILRVPSAMERSGNRQSLLHYSTNILTSSITTLLATSHTPLSFLSSPQTVLTMPSFLQLIPALSSFFFLLASSPSFHLPHSAVPFPFTDLAIIACRPL
jgi:hypothetical protein